MFKGTRRFLRPDVRTTVNVNTAILWYETPCTLVSIDILKYTVSHSRRQQSPNRQWTISRITETGRAAGYSETSIYTYQTTRCPVPTRQAMYVQRNIQARSYNHSCSGKAISINVFWLCVCSLRYTACNAHAPYCHLWPLWLYSIFPHCLINGMIFGEKVTAHKMCVLIFSTTFVWSISHAKKNWARCVLKC